MPLVVVLEGAGARVAKSLERYIPHPHDLGAIADCAGVVPTVAVVVGPSAGHGAFAAALADFVVMVRGRARCSRPGPACVRRRIGEDDHDGALGGADVHTTGAASPISPWTPKPEAFAAARRYLSYLPSSAWSRPPVHGEARATTTPGPDGSTSCSG